MWGFKVSVPGVESTTPRIPLPLEPSGRIRVCSGGSPRATLCRSFNKEQQKHKFGRVSSRSKNLFQSWKKDDIFGEPKLRGNVTKYFFQSWKTDDIFGEPKFRENVTKYLFQSWKKMTFWGNQNFGKMSQKTIFITLPLNIQQRCPGAPPRGARALRTVRASARTIPMI